MNFRAPIKVLTLALALWSVSTVSQADDCRMYPPGPKRFACASQKNPALLGKQERCKEKGQAMGLLPGSGGRHALENFVMACMQR